MSKRNQGGGSPDTYRLDTATLLWQDDETPLAADYDDIYFAGKLGLQESEYVFLQHNQLPRRWRDLASEQADCNIFTIGETGFGTGLNFLASWQLWRQLAPAGCQLHFISTEKHPLTLGDLRRSLEAWPSLQNLAASLLDDYPAPLPGHHTLVFDDGRVHLHLLLGDALDSLEQLCTTSREDLPFAHPWAVNAWFLDGFAPAKNPSLWNERLYRLMARLSTEGTTVATFTAVGEVRRGLSQQGFAMQKVKGFGRKREMLCGEFQHRPRSDNPAFHSTRGGGIRAPWYIPDTPPPAGARHIAVIGAGLAGTHTASALARRGLKVTLIDAADQLASAASGNPRGMLYTKLSPRDGLLSRFALTSFLFALRHYRQLNRTVKRELVDTCGVLQLACRDRDRRLLEQLREAFKAIPELVSFHDVAGASAVAGIPLQHPGWFFPGAGWANPPGICEALAGNDNIEIQLGTPVAALVPTRSSSWQLIDPSGNTITDADAVVIATAHSATHFQQCIDLPIKIIRGQITRCPANDLSASLNTVICHEGYLTPAIDGVHYLGATFDIDNADIEVQPEDHRRNLDSLNGAIPDLFPEAEPASLGGRAALRCASPDYLPLIGPVPVTTEFIRRFADLRKNAHSLLNTPGCYYPGLYLNICHGSRGLTSTPLCAEILAATIHREPAPLERDLLQALNPARFIIRNLIRNKI